MRASKWLSSTIRKVSVRGKHRVTDVIWLKLDPELSGRRMQPFTSVWDLLGVQLTEFQSADWHIPLSSFIHALILFSSQLDLKTSIFILVLSSCYKLQSLLASSSKIWSSFVQNFRFIEENHDIYIFFFNLYLTRKPINYTCIES